MFDWSRSRPLISPSLGFSGDACGVKVSDLVLTSTLIEVECAIRAPPRRFDRHLVLADVSIYVCKGQRSNHRSLRSRGGFEHPRASAPEGSQDSDISPKSIPSSSLDQL